MCAMTIRALGDAAESERRHLAVERVTVRAHRFGVTRAAFADHVELPALRELQHDVAQAGAIFFDQLARHHDHTARGVEVLGTDTRFWEVYDFPQTWRAGHRYDFDIGFTTNMAPSQFFLTDSISPRDGTKLDMRFDCLMFDVVTERIQLYTNSLVATAMRFSCLQANARAGPSRAQTDSPEIPKRDEV